MRVAAFDSALIGFGIGSLIHTESIAESTIDAEPHEIDPPPMNKNSSSTQLTRSILVRLLGNVGSIALMTFAILWGESAWADPTVTRTSGSVLYIEEDTTPQLRGNYISYQITNDATPRTNVWVKLRNLPAYSSTGNITLAQYEDGLVQLGAMAAGETKTAFFYVYSGASPGQGKATSPTNSHNVDVYEGNPSQLGNLLINSTTPAFSFTEIRETLSTNANTVSAITTGPTPPELGGIVTIEITNADTKQVGVNDSIYLSPATFADWPANKFELFETSFTPTGSSVSVKDTLALTLNSQTTYTTIFKFRAVATTTQPTSVSSAMQIGSGNQVKHTDVSGYAANTAIKQIGTVGSNLQLQKLVSQSQLVAGGTVTYTLRLTNSGSQAAIIQDFMDTLPAGVTVVSGTSKFNGVAIAEPTGTGQTKTWAGSFSIPAGSPSVPTARDLTFQATIPNTEGTYLNSAIAHIGNVQIDSTLLTTDNAPATIPVQVTPPQGFKSVKLTVDADSSATISAGDTLTWTVSYINKSSTTSIPNFQITDLLLTNAPITSTGAQTISINTAQGSTAPNKNTSYTGVGTSNNLLASPINLLPGGVITVSIPVKINALTPANTILSNQSIATGTGLMAAGVNTDNVDRTTPSADSTTNAGATVILGVFGVASRTLPSGDALVSGDLPDAVGYYPTWLNEPITPDLSVVDNSQPIVFLHGELVGYGVGDRFETLQQAATNAQRNPGGSTEATVGTSPPTDDLTVPTGPATTSASVGEQVGGPQQTFRLVLPVGFTQRGNSLKQGGGSTFPGHTVDSTTYVDVSAHQMLTVPLNEGCRQQMPSSRPILRRNLWMVFDPKASKCS